MFDRYGSMFILDSGNSRVQKWASGVTFGVTIISSTMSTPLGMTFDAAGNILLADTGYHRISRYPLLCRESFLYGGEEVFRCITNLVLANPTTVTAAPPSPFFSSQSL